jgi:hypothetical protein
VDEVELHEQGGHRVVTVINIEQYKKTHPKVRARKKCMRRATKNVIEIPLHVWKRKPKGAKET